MIWYVALIALLNIGVGYALAVYLAGCRRANQAAFTATESADYYEEQDFGDIDDEYYSDGRYGADVEEAEYEPTAAR